MKSLSFQTKFILDNRSIGTYVQLKAEFFFLLKTVAILENEPKLRDYFDFFGVRRKKIRVVAFYRNGSNLWFSWPKFFSFVGSSLGLGTAAAAQAAQAARATPEAPARALKEDIIDRLFLPLIAFFRNEVGGGWQS